MIYVILQCISIVLIIIYLILWYFQNKNRREYNQIIKENNKHLENTKNEIEKVIKLEKQRAETINVLDKKIDLLSRTFESLKDNEIHIIINAQEVSPITHDELVGEIAKRFVGDDLSS